jgi:hypothetical protein
MQKVRVPINSFQYGEISDSLIMRTDSPVYGQSAQRLENLIVMSEGSVKKRTGLKHIYDYGLTYKASDGTGTADDDGIVTQFTNSGQTNFALNGTFVSSGVASFNNAGRFVTFYNDNNASAGNPIPSALNLTLTITGTDIYGLAQTEAIALDDNIATYTSTKSFKTVTAVSINTAPTNFNLKVGVTSTLDYLNKSDQSHLFKFIFDDNEEYIISVEHLRVRCFRLLTDGTISLVSTITQDTSSAALPFDEDYLQEYTAAQYGDVMFISHPLFAPRLLTRTSLTSFEIDTYSFDTRADNKVTYQPYSKFHASGVTLDPSAISGNGITLTTSANYWVADHVGTTVRYHESEITITGYTSATVVTGNIVDTLSARLSVLNPLRTREGSNVVEVTHINHGLNVGDAITVQNAAATGGINTGNLNVTDQVREIIDDNTYTYQAGGNASSSEDGGGQVSISCHAPTTTWDEQSFSAVRGYPAAVVFHENRLCFGGTLSEPDTIWMSKIGSFFNFDVGEAADDDSINLVAATGDSHEIRYMISNRDLQVFTSTGELYVPTYLNQAITPTNAQIRMQTPYGTEFVTPTSIDGATIFVQKNGRIIREYLYSDSEDAYTASAISTLASHLIDSPKYLSVAHSGFELADSYAAFSLTNGDLILFTSNRAEKRAAWTRVSTSGNFGSVIAIHSRLFANVYDSNGKLHLCEFNTDRGLDLWQSKSVVTNKVDASDVYSSGDLVDVYGYASSSGYTYLGEFTVDSNDDIDLSSYAITSTINYTVTVVNDGGNKYAIAGISGSAPQLSLGRGNTYVFDLSDASNAGHPFAFRTTADAPYTTGVTTTGTAGQAGAKVTIVVASDSPAGFKYYCTVHGNSMGNTIFSTAAINTYSSAEFGKKFTAKLVSNPIDANMGNGPSTGTTRGITNIVVDVKSTESMKVNSNDVIASSFTGKKEIKTLGYNRNPQITIEQDKPLGLQINGIVAELIV